MRDDKNLSHNSRIECPNKRILINDPSTSNIDYANSFFHLGKSLIIEHLCCSSRERHMQRNEIRRGNGLVKAHKLHANGPSTVSRSIRVVSNDVHTKALGTTSDFRAHLPKSKHSKCLPNQGNSNILIPLPLPWINNHTINSIQQNSIIHISAKAISRNIQYKNWFHTNKTFPVQAYQRKRTRVGLGDVPGHSGEERDPVLGGGDGVGSGRIDDQAAMLGGGGQIDVIDSDAGSAYDLEPAGGGLEDLARDLGAAAHDERVAERDLCAEFLGTEVVGAIHVGEVLQKLQPCFAQLLRDQHRRLRVQPRRHEHHERPGAASLRAE
ncbi:hypothetical protein CR513_40599, partial [Mucuna pruriens]